MCLSQEAGPVRLFRRPNSVGETRSHARVGMLFLAALRPLSAEKSTRSVAGRDSQAERGNEIFGILDEFMT